MVGGSRPASSQPPVAASSCRPTSTAMRSAAGTLPKVVPRLLRAQAIPAREAAVMFGYRPSCVHWPFISRSVARCLCQIAFAAPEGKRPVAGRGAGRISSGGCRDRDPGQGFDRGAG
jgi:hypothetical protein